MKRLYDDFASDAVIPMLLVPGDDRIDLSLNLFLTVAHQLVERDAEEISQRLKKCDIGIRFARITKQRKLNEYA